MKTVRTLTNLIILSGLLLTAAACGQQNQDEAEDADVKYVYPAETIPVSPDTTQTRQDNTEVEKDLKIDSTAHLEERKSEEE